MVVLLALAIVGLLPGFQNFYRHIVKFGFGVDRHQYHFTIGESCVINHPSASALPCAHTLPANFAQGACTRNHIASEWVFADENNKGFVLGLGPNAFDHPLKDRRLNDG
jgi:hypothetical protein